MEFCDRCKQAIDSSTEPFYFFNNKPVHENSKHCIDALLAENTRLRNADILKEVQKSVPEVYRWYRIVDAWSTDDLAKQVDILMLEGWHLVGGVTCATLISNQATFHFYQAMQRTE